VLGCRVSGFRLPGCCPLGFDKTHCALSSQKASNFLFSRGYIFSFFSFAPVRVLLSVRSRCPGDPAGRPNDDGFSPVSSTPDIRETR
jgi:hypothetical protein